jgi:hypothetical protein
MEKKRIAALMAIATTTDRLVVDRKARIALPIKLNTV